MYLEQMISGFFLAFCHSPTCLSSLLFVFIVSFLCLLVCLAISTYRDMF